MLSKLRWILLVCVLLVSMILISCQQASTTTSSSTTTTTQSVTTTSPPSTTTSATAPAANWWDKFGEPQYGGQFNIRINSNAIMMDSNMLKLSQVANWESLFHRDWAVDRAICDFKYEAVDEQYYKDGLAKSWERTDPTTITVHLEQGVKWQNKPPLNGREFTAEDVQYTYDRLFGTGSGFTAPLPTGMTMFYPSIERVIAVDKYTVQFKLKNPYALTIYDVFDGGFFAINIIPHELVEQDLLKDWHNAITTGPWLLTEYAEGVTTTFAKNPDYWKFDERHPKNKLPYMDGIKVLVIPDQATTLATLRTSKLDILEEMNQSTWQQAKSLNESNPEILQDVWASPGQTLEMRCDREPFTDINVRKALQMALDLKTIGATHYGGLVTGDPEGMVSPGLKGWTIPYAQWPADLQAEYSFNPAKAKELLGAAGYPNGFKTSVIAQPGGEDLELLQIIKSQFADIGVEMEIQMFADQAAKSSYAQQGKAEQMVYTNTAGHVRPPWTALAFRMTGQRENYTYNNDKDYEAMVSKMQQASTIDEAKKYGAEIDMYFLRKHWVVTTFSTRSPIFWQPWVKGNSGEQTVAGAYFYYTRWWMDSSLRK